MIKSELVSAHNDANPAEKTTNRANPHRIRDAALQNSSCIMLSLCVKLSSATRRLVRYVCFLGRFLPKLGGTKVPPFFLTRK